MTDLRDELLGELFPESSGPKTPAPFPRAKQMKKGPQLVNNSWIESAYRAQSNGDVELMDPRSLRATQTWVTKPGVHYYLGDDYALTGETYADKHILLNRFPVIYVRTDGEARIVSGHHRSTAALLKDELIQAIVVREPWTGSSPSAFLVTPRLVIGTVEESDEVSARAVDGTDEAARAIRSSERVAVPTAEMAVRVLVRLGSSEEEAKRRIAPTRARRSADLGNCSNVTTPS